MVKMTKSVIPPISYFSARPKRLHKLLIWLVLMNQSFGKKINGKNDKKRHSSHFLFFCQA
ncbi:conserved hypothetical protein [Carnobacterium maltaromaticum]|nr:conserved hypothetical protein [Carnobacterium maltaromaticum]